MENISGTECQVYGSVWHGSETGSSDVTTQKNCLEEGRKGKIPHLDSSLDYGWSE